MSLPVQHTKTLGRSIILQRAGKLLSQRGYFGVSMQDIAAASNITKSTLYYHFRSKDDLIEELLKKAVAELRIELFNAVELSENPAEALFSIIKTLLDFKIKHPEITILSMTISSDESLPILQHIEDMKQEVVKLIRELVGGLDLVRATATKTALLLSSMILGVVMSPFDLGKNSPEQVANDLTTFFLRDPDEEKGKNEKPKR